MFPSDLDIRLGDGIAGMRKVTDVDLILTDIPSGKTQNQWDKLPDLSQFFEVAWSTLKPSGALIVFVSHLDVAAKLAVFPHFRYDLVWRKTIATGFFTAKNRPLKGHEHVLVFYRQQPTYNVQMRQGFEPIHAATRRSHGSNYGKVTKVTKSRAGATDRYPDSVLDFNSVGTTAKERRHPQQKPVDLLEWFVLSFTNPGDLVVDPFAGSGSTGEAAVKHNRRFVGWEIRSGSPS